jgi:hypothetical protein
MLYTNCFFCWTSLTGPVLINVPRSVFSFEDISEMGTVPDASEFLGSVFDIRDDDSALLYYPEEG